MLLFIASVSYAFCMSTDLDFPFSCLFTKAEQKAHLGKVLEEAIEAHDIDRVQELVNQGVSIATYKHLAYAAHCGYKDIVQFLLQKGVRAYKKYSRSKVSPLHEAIAGGHKEIVELLLEYGASVNSKARTGATPLYRAISAGYNEIVRLLLSKGANINMCCSDFTCSETPFLLAIKCNQPEIAEMLLNSGVCIESSLANLEACYWAVDTNNLLSTELLLFYGSIGVDFINDRGFTPINYAIYKNYPVLVELLTHYPELLKQAQQKPTHQLLYTAVRKGYYYLTRYLIAQSIKPDLPLLEIAQACYAQAEHKEPYRLIGRLLISYLRLMYSVGTSVDTRGPLAKNGLDLPLPKDIVWAIARLITLSSSANEINWEKVEQKTA